MPEKQGRWREGKDAGQNDGSALQVLGGGGAKRRKGKGWVPKGWLRNEDQGSATKKADEVAGVAGHRKPLPR